MKMLRALRRPLTVLTVAVGLLATMMTFQNCGHAFQMGDGSFSLGAPSQFPQNYTPYGNLPSQALTNYPAAGKVAAKAMNPTASGSGIVIVGNK